MFTLLAKVNISKATEETTNFTLKLTQTRHSSIGWSPASVQMDMTQTFNGRMDNLLKTLNSFNNWNSVSSGERALFRTIANTKIETYDIKYQLNHLNSEDASTKNIWKLELQNPENNPDLKNIYCIRAGLGFNQTEGQTDLGTVEGNTKEYKKAYTLPEDYSLLQTTLASSKADIFSQKELQNLNATLWILDNMILEDATDDEVESYLWEHGYETVSGIDEENVDYIQESSYGYSIRI